MPFIIRPSDEFAKNADSRNLSSSLANKCAERQVVTNDDLQIIGALYGICSCRKDDFDAAQKEMERRFFRSLTRAMRQWKTFAGKSEHGPLNLLFT